MSPILTIIFSILLGIISYFLVQTMIKINKNSEVTIQNSQDIALIKQEHDLKYDYLTKDFKELKDVLKDLTREIKELNSKMKQ